MSSISSARRILVVLVLLFSMILSITPTHAIWQFESENDRGRLSAYASSFWIEGIGPVSYEKFLNQELDEGTLWSVMTISCVRKSLAISISVGQAGSGNEDIKLDDPGYVDIRFDNAAQRRYRTYGTGDQTTLAIYNGVKTLVSGMMSKKRLSASPRIKYSTKRIPLVFDISGLSKAKTRFRYAGCSI